MKFTIARLGALTCLCFSLSQAQTQTAPRADPVTGPEAVATNADATYCFAQERRLDPARRSPSYLVLRLRVRVTYRNTGARPLILPLERARLVYTGFKQDGLTLFRDSVPVFDAPSLKPMNDLPADVSPDSPINPANDVFTLIPPGAEMTPALTEEIELPVNHSTLLKRHPDLRGRRVYIKLEFEHRDLTQALEANLSDRWAKFGAPWTGTLTTNVFAINVPKAPEAAPCVDKKDPKAAHPTPKTIFR